jgi:hypothetical protein
MQQVAAFLTAWGGPVAGGDSVASEGPDYDGGNTAKEQKLLLTIAAVFVGTIILCCGCSGAAGALKYALSVAFG